MTAKRGDVVLYAAEPCIGTEHVGIGLHWQWPENGKPSHIYYYIGSSYDDQCFTFLSIGTYVQSCHCILGSAYQLQHLDQRGHSVSLQDAANPTPLNVGPFGHDSSFALLRLGCRGLLSQSQDVERTVERTHSAQDRWRPRIPGNPLRKTSYRRPAVRTAREDA